MIYDANMDVVVKKSSLAGNMAVPGSKSQTIRAVLLGMLSDGISTIHNPLLSGDGISARSAAEALGANITEKGNVWTVQGTGGTPCTPKSVIDVGNSGTTASFVTGICGLFNGSAVITGDEQIRKRPIKAEIKALRELGVKADILTSGSDCPPVRVGGLMHCGVCHVEGQNSQHVSGILVPAAIVRGNGTVVVDAEDMRELPYIKLTMDWMKKFGAASECSADGKKYTVRCGQRYKASDVYVSGDWSAAAFLLAAIVCTESVGVIEGVDFADQQGDKRVVDILCQMGADITPDEDGGRLFVHGAQPLEGIDIDMNDIPDALPALSVAACVASGQTRFTTLSHIRMKESDRVAVMCEELKKCGADITVEGDTMTVRGGKILHGAAIDCHGDHRVAMAMTVCGLFSDGQMSIAGADCANVSFPGFYELLKSAGADITVK